MAEDQKTKKITVSIVTPESKIFEGKVDYVSVPAKSGGLGVLPRHVPIIAQLKVGIVKLIDEGKPVYVGICRGFFEFLNDKANILTEHALMTTEDQRQNTIEELKKKYNITQEITEETRKVVKAIAGLKTLR